MNYLKWQTDDFLKNAYAKTNDSSDKWCSQKDLLYVWSLVSTMNKD